MEEVSESVKVKVDNWSAQELHFSFSTCWIKTEQKESDSRTCQVTRNMTQSE